jgi:argininosuccinate lyase
MRWALGAALLLATPPAFAQIAVVEPALDRDRYDWVMEGNKASLIVLAEEGIVSRETAAQIARALQTVEARAGAPGADRDSNYLAIEKELMALMGSEASRLHTGRSRQDLGQVGRRGEWREAFLDQFEQFVEARTALLALAKTHPHEPLPFYTHAVQAQPTTLGHYLGGYLAAFHRQSERYRQAWPRINMSPLGGGVGGTSSFPLNRNRLAELLGFSAVIDNSFDAVQVALQDSGSEIVFSAATGSLLVSMLTADLLTQYGNPYPWFQLVDGDQSGRSSIMPQKRNPSAIEELHEAAGLTTGLSASWSVLAQSIPSGTDSYKKTPIPLNALAASHDMWKRMSAMAGALRFFPERALERLNEDYSVVTELANLLQREGGVPFRVGHHFASEMVNYGRANRLRAPDLPYAVAQKTFAASATRFGLPDRRFPLSASRFKDALNPKNMVRSARPRGGPQPAEVDRMLSEVEARIAADRQWLASERERLQAADRLRAAAFAALAREG